MVDMKLKNCPFCGGEAGLYARTSHVPNFDNDFIDAMWVADCSTCNANIELESSQMDAVSAWNFRATDSTIEAQEAEIKRLREKQTQDILKLHDTYEKIAPLLGLKSYKVKCNNEQTVWANSEEEADSLRLGRSIYTFVEIALGSKE